MILLNTRLLQHTAATCTGCFWCWAIWMLLSALLGLFIGKWIWGKYANIVAQKDKEIKSIKDKNSQVEKSFIAAKFQIEELEKDNKGLKASLANFQSEIMTLDTQLSRLRVEQQKDLETNPTTAIPVVTESTPALEEDNAATEDAGEEVNNPSTASTKQDPKEVSQPKTAAHSPEISNKLAIYTNNLKPTDLKIIEGVGPKIEAILNKEGYQNWSDIANSKVDDLKNIMHDAGPRYRIHNPATWNQQAKMAIKGDWQNLIDLQKILSSKRTGGEIDTSIPKIDKLIARKFGFENINSNDLKIVEGIGPQIEELLKTKGIGNWEELSKTTVGYLQKILADAGERYKLADPTTWPKQATLAYQKEWEQLKAFQQELSGGRK